MPTREVTTVVRDNANNVIEQWTTTQTVDEATANAIVLNGKIEDGIALFEGHVDNWASYTAGQKADAALDCCRALAWLGRKLSGGQFLDTTGPA